MGAILALERHKLHSNLAGCNLSELNKERSDLISMVVVTSFGSFPCLELDQSNLINFQIYMAKMTRFLGLLCVA